jgi:hypothetical protein
MEADWYLKVYGRCFLVMVKGFIMYKGPEASEVIKILQEYPNDKVTIYSRVGNEWDPTDAKTLTSSK